MGRFGITEILLLLGVALLLFGGTRVANIGKGLGEGIKNFKKGLKEEDEDPKQLGEKSEAVVVESKEEKVASKT
jgi:sec-independent protein translocase protein TatA